MTYRDDKDALLARNDALQRDLEARDDELEKTKAELARLRAGRSATQSGDQSAAEPKTVEGSERRPRRMVDVLWWLAPAPLVGLFLWGGIDAYLQSRPASIGAPATHLEDVCPVERGRPLVVIDAVEKSGSWFGDPDQTDRYLFLSLIEPTTGKRIARTSLGERILRCAGFQGNLIWLTENRGGLEGYSLETGERVVTAQQISAAASTPVHRSDYDWRTGNAYVMGTDGRRYNIEMSSGLRINESPATDATPGINPQPPQPWVSPGRRIIDAKERGQRRIVTVNGEPIGDRDFLNTGFLVSRQTDSWLWPDPDSVVFQEQTALDSRIHRLIRLGLDGTVVWEYQPPDLAAREWTSRPEGDVLFYFTPNAHVIAVDAKTGRPRYEVRL